MDGPQGTRGGRRLIVLKSPVGLGVKLFFGFLDPRLVGTHLGVDHAMRAVVRCRCGIASVGHSDEKRFSMRIDECRTTRVPMAGAFSVGLIKDHFTFARSWMIDLDSRTSEDACARLSASIRDSESCQLGGFALFQGEVRFRCLGGFVPLRKAPRKLHESDISLVHAFALMRSPERIDFHSGCGSFDAFR